MSGAGAWAVRSDLRAIERSLARFEHPTRVGEAARYCLAAGGKRARPMLTCVMMRALGADPRPLVDLAAAVEMVHAGTLLHDDVIDGSERRRGRAAAHHVFDAHTAILAGDSLLCWAFDRLAREGPRELQIAMAQVVRDLADGEALERERRRDATVDLAHARRVNRLKTAALFGYAAEAGAILAGADPELRAAALAYGLAVGEAFQTVDDLLDWHGDPEAVGKPLGHDLAEGLVTVPTAMGLAADGGLADELRAFWQVGGTVADAADAAARLARVRERLAAAGALDAARALAAEDADRAIAALDPVPAGPWRVRLAEAARRAVQRDR